MANLMSHTGSLLILVVTGPPIITSERKILLSAKGKTEQPMKRITPTQTPQPVRVKQQSGLSFNDYMAYECHAPGAFLSIECSPASVPYVYTNSLC